MEIKEKEQDPSSRHVPSLKRKLFYRSVNEAPLRGNCNLVIIIFIFECLLLFYYYLVLLFYSFLSHEYVGQEWDVFWFFSGKVAVFARFAGRWALCWSTEPRLSALYKFVYQHTSRGFVGGAIELYLF